MLVEGTTKGYTKLRRFSFVRIGMEPVGFTIGVLGLCGLFSNAIDCFEYIQLGRNFSKSFQTCLLKLDNARLRLSRWGKSVGLAGDAKDISSLREIFASAEDRRKTEAILGQILVLFADAEGILNKFKSRAKADDKRLIVCGAEEQLVPAISTLHHKMRDIAIKRQNSTGVRQKAKWALYEEKHFTGLIENITHLVDSLVELFPVAQVSQHPLGTGGTLPVPEDVTAGLDKHPEAASMEVINEILPAQPFLIIAGL